MVRYGGEVVVVLCGGVVVVVTAAAGMCTFYSNTFMLHQSKKSDSTLQSIRLA